MFSKEPSKAYRLTPAHNDQGKLLLGVVGGSCWGGGGVVGCLHLLQ